jgi:hypothetical protein
MMGVEERLAHVEGLVGGHAQLLSDLRTAVTSLEGRIDRRFDLVETRFTQIEGRLTGLGQTFDQKLDSKVDALDQKLDSKVDALDQKLDAKFGALDQKLDGVQREMSTHFRWTMGALLTIVAVFLGAVLAQ